MKKIIFILPLFLVVACVDNHDQEAEDHANDHSDHLSNGETVGMLTRADLEKYQAEVGKASFKPIGDTLVLRGEIHAPPQSRIDVALPFGGLVKSLNFYPGSYVEKGAVLATVQHNDYISLQEDYLMLMAEKDLHESNWKRQEHLDSNASTSAKVLQEAKSAYEVTNARLQGVTARLKLSGISPDAIEKEGIQELITLRAPSSGYIAEIMANIGSYVAANAPVYSIVNQNHLHIELAVYPDDVPRLRVGQNVEFRLGKDDQTHSGKVFLISKNVSENSRMVQVHVHPDNESIPGMLPGMFVRATVHLNTDSAYVLPASAAHLKDGKYTGLKLKGDTLYPVTFDDRARMDNGTISVSVADTGTFVTGNLSRMLAAYYGESDGEAGHSH